MQARPTTIFARSFTSTILEGAAQTSPFTNAVSETISTPTSSSLGSTDSPVPKTGLSPGAKVGIVIGAIAGALAITGVFFFMHYKNQNMNRRIKELEVQSASQYLSTDGYDWRNVTWSNHEIAEAETPQEMATTNIFEMGHMPEARELDNA